MNFKSILIVTYGRSGSTLLQGVINSINGCTIKGENNNFCFYLYKTYQAILEAKTHKDNTEFDPWYGANLLDEELFLLKCREYIESYILADIEDISSIKCFGFKGLYHPQWIVNGLEGYLEFLGKVFPDVGYIFNTRNLDQVLKSGWWKQKDYYNSKQLLLNLEKKFSDFSRFHTNCYHITYEDVVNKTDRLKQMFDFIGTNYDSKLIESVLSKRYSYAPNQEHVKKKTLR